MGIQIFSVYSIRNLIIVLHTVLRSWDVYSQEDHTYQESNGKKKSQETDTLEMEILGFRLWMIIGFVLTGLLVIVVGLCCIIDCRIPRTKQEIEASHEKKDTKRMREAGLYANGHGHRKVGGELNQERRQVRANHSKDVPRVPLLQQGGGPIYSTGSMPAPNNRDNISTLTMRPTQQAAVRTLGHYAR